MTERFGDDYLARLQEAVQHLSKCEARWLCSLPVDSLFRGPAIRHGKVDLFCLTGHPEAEKAYAWAERVNHDSTLIRYVVVFEIPPVESAETAVWFWIWTNTKDEEFW